MFTRILLTYKDKRAKFGDVVLYDGETFEIFATQNFASYNPNKYKPIGIVVIPAAHNVYGTGECGIVALTNAEPGESKFSWGNYGLNYPELEDFSKLPCYGFCTGELSELITGEASLGIIPAENKSTDNYEVYPNDVLSDYKVIEKWSTDLSNYGYLPSPYKNYSRNLDYFIGIASGLNALSDFRGKENTEYLCSISIDIENAPAANICNQYCTSGTVPGDWHLPSCGEFGYIPPRFDSINIIITKLSSWAGIVYRNLDKAPHWTSTERAGRTANRVFPHNGIVDNGNRMSPFTVRPFMRRLVWRK